MASLDFEGRPVPVEDGDTVASALYRAGVRTFTRSLKYHRRRGLYCLTGDCPNCLVSLDGEPGVRSCCTQARDGQRVEREAGTPSADFDLLHVTDRLHRFMPVGFYYKTFIRPRFAWELAERIIRRATGLGRLPVDRAPRRLPMRNAHADVVVIGAGIAGLAAAKSAAGRGDRVLICDEGTIGERISDRALLGRIRALAGEVRALPNVTVLERHAAIGVYEGPLVPLAGENELVQVRPARVVVATGAAETHAVFRGNDIPGVWLGRGAARMASGHGIAPAGRAVVAVSSVEGVGHVETLLAAGVEIAAVAAPSELGAAVRDGIEVLEGGRVVEAVGSKGVRAAVVEFPSGERRRVACDAVVLSLGLGPRDDLLRMVPGEFLTGAGDVVVPGCSHEEAEESGCDAGAGSGALATVAADGHEDDCAGLGNAGTVCLCEDVGVMDLEAAWEEGWQSSEILKRYTTATMGPCRGAMCGRRVACFARERADVAPAGARTTARPPVRPVALETLASAVHEVIEKRTALHERHERLGARLDWSGSWKRPFGYGDTREEYLAVRGRVSVMDVSTLGKLLIAGPDAKVLVDRLYPTRIDDLAPGRSRYLLALGEAGYVFDDGLICALDGGRYYVTSTSGGADAMEAWVRDWSGRWGLETYVVSQTAMLGAILVAGPHSRELLATLSDDDLSPEAIPHMSHAEITVAGVPCRALRVGFVGELGFELHHPRGRSGELWDALLAAGAPFGIRPHGLDALEVLRLEKGHIYLGQDTLPDDTPAKLGMEWAIADKPSFVGKVALERMSSHPLERRLVGLEFASEPERGAPLYAGGRIVGRVTSCTRSEVLGKPVGLGWIRARDGEFASKLRAGEIRAWVTDTPFYDPEGARLRA